jgi:hypothetical protein
MYTQYRHPHLNDPLYTMCQREMEQRHSEAARRRLIAQAYAARSATAPAQSLLCRWLRARLPAWSRLRRTPNGPVRPTELSKAIRGGR